jgi:DNA excision repair protein ERCC-4
MQPFESNHGTCLPTVIVDTREQTPLRFSNLPTTSGTLSTGDYSFVGGEEVFAIERKSIADLTACCTGSNRERFEREMHRLRGFHFKRLLIVGSVEEVERHKYRSQVKPQCVLGSLAAWEVRYDTPVVFTPTPDAAARLIEGWVYRYARELLRNVEHLHADHQRLR